MKNKTIQKSHGIAMVNKNKKKKGKFFYSRKTSSKRKLVLTRL